MRDWICSCTIFERNEEGARPIILMLILQNANQSNMHYNLAYAKLYNKVTYKLQINSKIKLVCFDHVEPQTYNNMAQEIGPKHSLGNVVSTKLS